MACIDATVLACQTGWLDQAAAMERERGRAGSWLHDRHRLSALRQLHSMALCLARLRQPEPGAETQTTAAMSRGGRGNPARAG